MAQASDSAPETASAGSSAEPAAIKSTAAEPAADAGASAGTEPGSASSAAPASSLESTATAATSAAPANAATEGASTAAQTGTTAANASANTEAPLEDVGELLPPTDKACESAREVVKHIYEIMMRMKKAKEAKDDSSVADDTRDFATQLLLLRRCHRAMKKAVDLGKASEALKRKEVDEETLNWETRRHLGACLRAVAQRNRNVPIPHLRRLLPSLKGGADREMDVDNPDDDLATPDELEAEHKERLELSKRLEALQQKKAKEVEEFRTYGRQRVTQDELVRKWFPLLSEWNNALTLKHEKEADPVDAGLLLKLPTALQLVYKKFDNLVRYDDDAPTISLHIEGTANTEGPPPEKRAKTKAGADVPAVCVKVNLMSKPQKEFTLRFTVQQDRGRNLDLVHVSIAVPKASSSSHLLDNLWPEDIPSLQGASSDAAAGKAYYWAQVLSGLGGQLLSGAPALQSLSQVSAKDVVQRVSERLRPKT